MDYASEEECRLIFNAQSTAKVIQCETQVIELQVNVKVTVHNAALCVFE